MASDWQETRAADSKTAERILQLVHGPLTLAAAVLYIPALFLHFSHTRGALSSIGEGLWWAVWSVFALKLVSGLLVSYDRTGYIRQHKVFTFVVCFGFPLLPGVFELVPALGVISSLGLFELVDLMKLAEGTHLAHMSAARARRFRWVLAVLLVLVSAVLALSALGAILDREKWGREPHPLQYMGKTLERLVGNPQEGGLAIVLLASVLFAVLIGLSAHRSAKSDEVAEVAVAGTIAAPSRQCVKTPGPSST